MFALKSGQFDDSHRFPFICIYRIIETFTINLISSCLYSYLNWRCVASCDSKLYCHVKMVDRLLVVAETWDIWPDFKHLQQFSSVIFHPDGPVEQEHFLIRLFLKWMESKSQRDIREDGRDTDDDYLVCVFGWNDDADVLLTWRKALDSSSRGSLTSFSSDSLHLFSIWGFLLYVL